MAKNTANVHKNGITLRIPIGSLKTFTKNNWIKIEDFKIDKRR